MCGRFSLAAAGPAQLRVRFPIGESVEVRQRFNVPPGDEVLTVTTDREGAPRGELLRWGLVPQWADDPRVGMKMINARAETLLERPAFRPALERFRCLIVADGFYEWQAQEGAPKQPFHVTRADHEPFAFAGLWSVWARGSADELRTCTIITTAASSRLESLHPRMPVILDRELEGPWLDAGVGAGEALSLLGGLDAAHTALRPVGPAVNDARYDGAACLDDPLPPAQSALF